MDIDLAFDSALLLALWGLCSVGFYIFVARRYVASVRRLAITRQGVEADPGTTREDSPRARPPRSVESARSRSRLRPWVYLAAGGCQAVCTGLAVLLLTPPNTVNLCALAAATATFGGPTILLQAAGLLGQRTIVGRSGLGSISLIYGFVMAAFSWVTAGTIGDGIGQLGHLPMFALALQAVLLVATTAVFLVGIRAYVAAARVLRLSPPAMWSTMLWLGTALCLGLIFLVKDGPLAGLAPLASHAVYWLVAAVPGSWLAADTQGRADLLFLRTLSIPRSGELLRRLARSWAEVGALRLLTGSDSAMSTLDPAGVLAFLTGRLHRYVISTPTDLSAALREPEVTRDGAYEVRSLTCAHAAWKATVVELMARSNVVLMDLRGFGAQNEGCIFEIEALGALRSSIPVFLLHDRTTDQGTLSRTIRRAFPDEARVHLIDCDATLDLDALLSDLLTTARERMLDAELHPRQEPQDDQRP